MTTALVWLLAGLAVVDPATPVEAVPVPTVVVEGAVDHGAPAPSVEQTPVATRRPELGNRPAAGFRPTVPVAVATGVGLLGVTLGGLTATLTPERGARAFSAGALVVGAAGFATAGVLLLVGGDDDGGTQVRLGPAAVSLKRAF